MTEAILKYWPMPKDKPPRRTQVDALDWAEVIPSHIKYLLCEIPVGGGKSPYALNLSGWLSQSFGDAYILTPQRILQKQYEDSFEPHLVGSMYGKGNYECVKKKTNCDIGSDIKPRCDNCPAREAFDIAVSSPNMILNYTLALLLFKYADPTKMTPRKLLVFDECHTLEGHLIEFNAITISEQRCKKMGIAFYTPKTITLAMEWLSTTYLNAVINTHRKYVLETDEINADVEYNPRALTKDEQQSFRNYKEFGEHLKAIQLMCEKSLEEISERFVLVNEKTIFKFKELYGKSVFHSLVKPMADKFLFMSSTILNKDAFCKDLGLNPEEAAFISLPSEFPVDNRPVIFLPQMKMNYEWSQDKNSENRKDMIVKIKEICEAHGTDSGIIHTGSFQIAEWLTDNLTGLVQHDVMHHNPGKGFKRDEVIAEFQRVSPHQPTLLISPSITEGLDLKDDLARFAIFIKVPYPNMGDAWVKRRMEISNEWYSRQAMIAIIQGAGRIVRSPSDYGYTYILDASFSYLYQNMAKWIPDWWKDGYQRM